MNKETTLTSLASLAMLKVNIDSGKDYLEYLRPFVMQLLASGQIENISDVSIAQGMQENYGLIIPRRTIQIVIQRIARLGFLEKKYKIFEIKKEIPVNNYIASKADATQHISAVIDALVDFSRNSAKGEISEEDALDAIILFLAKFSIPCLKAYLRGTTLPDIVSTGNWKLILVSQFVHDIYEKSPRHFESFIVLVKGHMLANALLCPDLQSVSKTYDKVTFYFDTPLLIQFLGLESDTKKCAIDELINLIQNLKGTVAYFEHTRNELIDAIRYAADYVHLPKGYGSIVYEARKKDQTKSDLILIAEHAEQFLEKANIHIKTTPTYKQYDLQIDEKALFNVLSSKIKYHSTKAIYNDINSVRSIYVLRRKACPNSVENSAAVFVTSNFSLSKVVFGYGKKVNKLSEVSAVITDFSLANVAWLKAPHGAPSLPQKEVIAFVYATLRPSDEFLQKVLTETDKLEKDGEISVLTHQLLRSSQHAQEELMNLTLGEDEALTARSFNEIFSQVSADIKKEETEKLTVEQAARRKAQERVEKIQEHLYWRYSNMARNFSRVVSFVLLCIIVPGFVASIGLQSSNPMFKLFLLIGLIMFMVLTFGNLLLGTTIKHIYELMQEKFKNWLFQRAARKIGIKPKI